MSGGTVSDRSRGGAGRCGCASVETDAADTCYCTVDDLVDAISRKHSLSVLNFVGSHGPVRFGDLEEGLSGISSSTLSETLGLLAGVGLLERKAYPEAPPRVEYRTTEAGETLRRRFHELLDRIREGGPRAID